MPRTAPRVQGDTATIRTVTSLDLKASVRVATAAALPACTASGVTLTGDANGALAAVDGVTLVAGDSLLVKDQVAGANNGIYVVTQLGTASLPFILTRRSDADTSAKVTAGMATFASEGTANGNKTWALTTDDTITLGTTALTFTQAASGLLSTATPASVGAGVAATAGSGTLASKDDHVHAVSWDTNGAELILDADGNTSITADTDNQIDIKVAGSDDFQITANTFTALSGSTIATNTIAETTGNTGVTVDSCLIKDGVAYSQDERELAPASFGNLPADTTHRVWFIPSGWTLTGVRFFHYDPSGGPAVPTAGTMTIKKNINGSLTDQTTATITLSNLLGVNTLYNLTTGADVETGSGALLHGTAANRAYAGTGLLDIAAINLACAASAELWVIPCITRTP